MKHTYCKLFFRTVRGSLSRFLSIFFIVALGVGFLAGLLATTPDMRLTANTYYNDSYLMDLRVVSTLGLTDEDIAAIAATDGVAAVMPSQTVDAVITLPDGATAVLRMHTLPQDTESDTYLNRPVLLSGRMPQAAGECIAVQGQYDKSSVKIGDRFAVSGDVTPNDRLQVDALTVVGIVRTAYYCSGESESTTVGDGKISRTVYVTTDTVQADTFTDAFLTLTDARTLDTYSDDYKALTDTVTDRLKTLGEVRAADRRASLVADAQATWDKENATYLSEKAKAEKELKNALAAIRENEQKLDDAEKMLTQKREELESGKKALENGKKTLADKREAAAVVFAEHEKQLADTAAQLTEAGDALAVAKKQLDELADTVVQTRAQLAAAQANGTPEQVAALQQTLSQLETAHAQQSAVWQENADALTAAAAELDAADATLQAEKENAEKEFAAAEAKLSGMEETLQNGEAALSEGEQSQKEGAEKLKTAKADYAAAKKTSDEALADAAKKLADAQKQINDIAEGAWYVLDRNTNVGYVSFHSNTEKVEAIAKVFPVFFFLVAALVALTTMTRLVEEQRAQIGTLFALGYSRRVIAANYLLYAGLATVGGSILGLLIGFKVLPTVIFTAYSILYTMPPLVTTFNTAVALLAADAALVCTIAATAAACGSTLRTTAARLMQPKAPKAGKRVFLEHIPFIWKHLSFTRKVTARNLLRYKKRFFMTVVGIAGCTALLLTGFGLRDAISDIVSIQFTDIYQYDLTLKLKDDTVSDALLALMTERTSGRLAAAQVTGKVTKGGDGETVTLTVPADSAKLADFVRLRERKTGEPLSLTDDTILLTEKQATALGVQKGDTVTLENDDGKTADIKIGGVIENYISGYVYLTPTLFQTLFGETPAYTTLWAKADVADAAVRSALMQDILACDGVSSASSSADLIDTFSRVFHSIDYIVIVLIVSAALLAFIVLYNLTNINIGERQREIATIKVLGFFDREVDAYIYRETAALSIIGTLFGLIFGIFLCRFVVKTAEVDMVMFGRHIKAMSFVLSAAITLLFSFFVNLVMHPRLKKIDMVESLKSNE